MHEIGMEEYKERVLEVLVKIDKICRKNNFTYMLFYGTLLGAVRHKGFIPWDDDIDIVMPREDYYKLGKYIIEHPELELNYIDVSNRDDTFYYCAKVCDARTVVNESRFRHIKGYGAFVDVFPLDYLPEKEKERIRYRNKELFWERVIQHSAEMKPGSGHSLMQIVRKNLAFYGAKLFDAHDVLLKMHKRYIKFDEKPTKYMGLPWDGIPYESDWLKNRIEIEFEGRYFYAPSEIDKVLTRSFGDYMQLPPENERVYKHHLKCYWAEQ